jgi:hypothetical protein
LYVHFYAKYNFNTHHGLFQEKNFRILLVLGSFLVFLAPFSQTTAGKICVILKLKIFFLIYVQHQCQSRSHIELHRYP